MLQLLFFALHAAYCLAFTKDLRSFGVDLDPTNGTAVRVYFDRAVTPLRKASDTICVKLGCEGPSNGTTLAAAVRSLIDAEKSAALSSILTEYYLRSQSAAASRWLALSDDVTRRQSQDSQSEVDALRIGTVRPREHCISNNSAVSRSRKGCLLAKIFDEDELRVTGRQKPLDYWLAAAEKLFNGLYYDHVESLLYFLLKQITASQLDLREDYHYNRALIMLTEVSKEKGYLKESVYFALLVIDSCSDSPVTSALHRLRLLLTVPPIPPRAHVAVQQRRQMVADLYSLLDDLIEESLSITMKELSSGVNSTPFHIAHQGLNDLDIQTVLSAIYSHLCPDLLFLSPHLSERAKSWSGLGVNSLIVHSDSPDTISVHTHIHTGSSDDRTDESAAASEAPDLHSEQISVAMRHIKVGFVSTNFYDHSIGRMLVELLIIMHLKGQQFILPIEVIVFFVDNSLTLSAEEQEDYSSGERRYTFDGPATGDFVVNTLTERLGPSFRRLPPFLPLLQREVAGKGLDFLMFTDLGMDFTTYALAHSRLASYQAAWWGHPITSGAATMDFYFGLDIEVPSAGPDHYSEQLVRMDVMNSAPIRPIDSRSSEQIAATYRSISLPSDSRICMVLGRLFKLHPDFDDALAGVLVQSPDNTVLVLVAEKIGEWNQIIYGRLLDSVVGLLLQEAETHHGDLGPEDERNGSFEREDAGLRAAVYLKKVRFVTYERYSDFLLLAEVVLDTYPYGGCLTAHDALSNGVPMVTLPLEHVRGRYALGMYHQMGIEDLVASSPAEYIALTIRLLTDGNYRREQHEKIKHHYSHDFHKNSMVADEWLGFINQLTFN